MLITTIQLTKPTILNFLINFISLITLFLSFLFISCKLTEAGMCMGMYVYAYMCGSMNGIRLFFFSRKLSLSLKCQDQTSPCRKVSKKKKQKKKKRHLFPPPFTQE